MSDRKIRDIEYVSWGPSSTKKGYNEGVIKSKRDNELYFISVKAQGNPEVANARVQSMFYAYDRHLGRLKGNSLTDAQNTEFRFNVEKVSSNIPGNKKFHVSMFGAYENGAYVDLKSIKWPKLMSMGFRTSRLKVTPRDIKNYNLKDKESSDDGRVDSDTNNSDQGDSATSKDGKDPLIDIDLNGGDPDTRTDNSSDQGDDGDLSSNASSTDSERGDGTDSLPPVSVGGTQDFGLSSKDHSHRGSSFPLYESRGTESYVSSSDDENNSSCEKRGSEQHMQEVPEGMFDSEGDSSITDGDSDIGDLKVPELQEPVFLKPGVNNCWANSAIQSLMRMKEVIDFVKDFNIEGYRQASIKELDGYVTECNQKGTGKGTNPGKKVKSLREKSNEIAKKQNTNKKAIRRYILQKSTIYPLCGLSPSEEEALCGLNSEDREYLINEYSGDDTREHLKEHMYAFEAAIEKAKEHFIKDTGTHKKLIDLITKEKKLKLMKDFHTAKRESIITEELISILKSIFENYGEESDFNEEFSGIRNVLEYTTKSFESSEEFIKTIIETLEKVGFTKLKVKRYDEVSSADDIDECDAFIYQRPTLGDQGAVKKDKKILDAVNSMDFSAKIVSENRNHYYAYVKYPNGKIYKIEDGDKDKKIEEVSIGDVPKVGKAIGGNLYHTVAFVYFDKDAKKETPEGLENANVDRHLEDNPWVGTLKKDVFQKLKKDISLASFDLEVEQAKIQNRQIVLSMPLSAVNKEHLNAFYDGLGDPKDTTVENHIYLKKAQEILQVRVNFNANKINEEKIKYLRDNIKFKLDDKDTGSINNGTYYNDNLARMDAVTNGMVEAEKNLAENLKKDRAELNNLNTIYLLTRDYFISLPLIDLMKTLVEKADGSGSYDLEYQKLCSLFGCLEKDFKLTTIVTNEIFNVIMSKKELLEFKDKVALLHEAVKTGKIHEVDKYIKEGVNINKQDAYGNTALHYAFLTGNLNIASALIENDNDDYSEFYEKGISIEANIANNNGVTALHYAYLRVSEPGISADKEKALRELIKDLKAKGAKDDIYAKNNRLKPSEYSYAVVIGSLKTLIQAFVESNPESTEEEISTHFLNQYPKVSETIVNSILDERFPTQSVQ